MNLMSFTFAKIIPLADMNMEQVILNLRKAYAGLRDSLSFLLDRRKKIIFVEGTGTSMI